MPPKKTKAQKISLQEFLANDTAGSWADDAMEMPAGAPIASAYTDNGGRSEESRFGGYVAPEPRRPQGLARGRAPADRPDREQKALPDKPPYIAFLGGLPFSMTEDQVQSLMQGLNVVNIRLIRDRDDRPKGFGYIEFKDLESLKNALLLNGEHYEGRVLTVDVAEQQKTRGREERGGFRDDRRDEDFAGNWRRDAPLAPTRNRQTPDDFESRPRRDISRDEAGLDFGALRRGDVQVKSLPPARPRTERPVREQNPLPDKPPYIAYMGGLPFSMTEDQVKALLQDLSVVNIRLIRDRDDRPKGFGYVEFEDLESLKNALLLNGEKYEGRVLTVDVAEQQKERRREDRDSEGFRGRRNDDVELPGNWRRDTPLAPTRPRNSSDVIDNSARPPRRDNSKDRRKREEPNLDLGGFRRGDAPTETSAAGWTTNKPKRSPMKPREDTGADGISSEEKPAIKRSASQKGEKAGRPGKNGKSPEEIAEMEKKLFAIRVGAKQ